MALTRHMYKFGRNPDIDTTTDPEDIWDAGGIYGWPAAALTTTVAGATAADTATGSGMRAITVVGLDSDWKWLEESAAMAGTGTVTLSNSFLRVFRAFGTSAGTGGKNAGNIQVKHGATVLAQISAGNGQTLMAIYTVPADIKQAVLTGVRLNIATKVDTGASVFLYSRDNSVANPIWRVREAFGVTDTAPINNKYEESTTIFPAKTDIRLYVQEVAANNTDITGTFELRHEIDVP